MSSRSPIRVKKADGRSRISFYASVGAAVLIVIIGWILTVRSAITQDIQSIGAEVGDSMDSVKLELGETQKSIEPITERAVEMKDQFVDGLEVIQEAQEAQNAIIDSVTKQIEEENTSTYAEKETTE